MMEKGPILSPYSVLTSSFIDVCVIQNLYFSTQNQAVGHALWEGLPSGYLTPNPSPSLSNSSCQPRNLYLRPWTEARGELLVKQPLQRLEGGQGPDDFSGDGGQGEGEKSVRISLRHPRFHPEPQVPTPPRPSLRKQAPRPASTGPHPRPGSPAPYSFLPCTPEQTGPNWS